MTPRRRWLDADEHRCFRAFAGAARAVLGELDRDLERDAGMPRAYFEILYLLDQAPTKSLRMSDLAEATRSQPSRITHAVARLEEAGHVRRELCTADRRGWFAVLTDAGRVALDRAGPSLAASIRSRFFALLSADEREQLTCIGERLLAQIDAAGRIDGAGEPDTATVAADDARQSRRRDTKGALTP